MLKRIILIGFFFLCISPTVQAAELFSGENYTLPTTQIIDDNSIVISGETTINGLIKGDLIVTSGQTIINGTIEGDVLMAGGSLILNQDSTVNKNIRIMSGELMSRGLVKGTIHAWAGIVTITGPVQGNVYADSGSFILNAPIQGSVKVDSNNITLGDNALIHGDFKYTSTQPPKQAATAQVLGQSSSLPVSAPAHTQSTYWMHQGLRALSLWLIALILISIFPRSMSQYAHTVALSPVKNLGIGTLAISLSFLGAILLAITIIGLPLAVALILFIIISLYIAPIGWMLYCTHVLAKQNWLIAENNKLTTAALLLLSSFIIVGVLALPVVGTILTLFTTLISVGALTWTKWHIFKTSRQENIL